MDTSQSDANIDLLAISLLKRYKKWICAFFTLILAIGSIEYKVISFFHGREIEDVKRNHVLEIHYINADMKDQITIYKIQIDRLKEKADRLKEKAEENNEKIRELKEELNHYKYQ